MEATNTPNSSTRAPTFWSRVLWFLWVSSSFRLCLWPFNRWSGELALRLWKRQPKHHDCFCQSRSWLVNFFYILTFLRDSMPRLTARLTRSTWFMVLIHRMTFHAFHGLFFWNGLRSIWALEQSCLEKKWLKMWVWSVTKLNPKFSFVLGKWFRFLNLTVTVLHGLGVPPLCNAGKCVCLCVT